MTCGHYGNAEEAKPLRGMAPVQSCRLIGQSRIAHGPGWGPAENVLQEGQRGQLPSGLDRDRGDLAPPPPPTPQLAPTLASPKPCHQRPTSSLRPPAWRGLRVASSPPVRAPGASLACFRTPGPLDCPKPPFRDVLAALWTTWVCHFRSSSSLHTTFRPLDLPVHVLTIHSRGLRRGSASVSDCAHGLELVSFLYAPARKRAKHRVTSRLIAPHPSSPGAPRRSS